jgi:hypothetical protein
MKDINLETTTNKYDILKYIKFLKNASCNHEYNINWKK